MRPYFCTYIFAIVSLFPGVSLYAFIKIYIILKSSPDIFWAIDETALKVHKERRRCNLEIRCIAISICACMCLCLNH